MLCDKWRRASLDEPKQARLRDNPPPQNPTWRLGVANGTNNARQRGQVGALSHWSRWPPPSACPPSPAPTRAPEPWAAPASAPAQAPSRGAPSSRWRWRRRRPRRSRPCSCPGWASPRQRTKALQRTHASLRRSAALHSMHSGAAWRPALPAKPPGKRRRASRRTHRRSARPSRAPLKFPASRRLPLPAREKSARSLTAPRALLSGGPIFHISLAVE